MGCYSSRAAVAPQPVTSSSSFTGVAKTDEDIRDRYDMGALLGSGSFGQVREATLKEPPFEVRAVKMIERDNEDGEWSNQAIFVREVGLLQNIKHKNVIKYFDVYEDHHFLYVVMELCRGGEVFAKIVELKRFSEHHAATLGKQMLQAIDYIHKVKITHRDIKAENFMLATPTWPSTVKMIDFGMACKFEEGQVLTELCGSPHYLAPELIGQKYNHMADVWAFGVLLYLIMYGQYPYDAKHSRDIMVKILTENIKWQTKVKLSTDAVSLLKQLLEHNPKKRLTAEQALQHSWIKDRVVAGGQGDAEALPTEVVRSAHKRVTSARKQVDPKIEAMRNEKLQKLDEDYSRGIRNGQRLGETRREEFMTKPEFLRRENKLTTSPSQQFSPSQLENRQHSMERLAAMAASPQPKAADAAPAAASAEGSSQEPQPRPSPEQQNTPASARKGRRAQSVSGSMTNHGPRRLSYIGQLSDKEERNLASLYEEKRIAAARKAKAEADKEAPELSAIVPNGELR